MRHNNAGRRLGRTTSHRIAMFRNMVTSLLDHERITTTDTKAKELRSVVDKMITLGKKGDLHAMRLASSFIRDKKVVTKLFSTIAPRYKERCGGYTRIIKLGMRPGDNAPVSIIELVEEQLPPKKTQKTPPVKVTAKAVPVEVMQSQEPPATVNTAEATTDAVPLTAVTEVEETCEAKAD